VVTRINELKRLSKKHSDWLQIIFDETRYFSIHVLWKVCAQVFQNCESFSQINTLAQSQNEISELDSFWRIFNDMVNILEADFKHNLPSLNS
jgi:hypothetical protein